jgi:hypothetical protein
MCDLWCTCFIDDGEEKKLFRALILRKRRHQKRAKERDQKWSKICKKAKKKRKKEQTFSFCIRLHKKHLQREREKALVYERKKR